MSSKPASQRPGRHVLALAGFLFLSAGTVVYGQSAVPGSDTSASVSRVGGVPTNPPAVKSTSASKSAVPERSPAVEDAGGGIHQGVHFHGHWVIDVKNSDGTVAEHRDFENSIVDSGPGFLVGLMSGYLVPGDYMIVMEASSGASPCLATSNFCGIVRSLSTYPGVEYCSYYLCATGLTVTPSFGSGGLGGPSSLVLAGSITANQAGSIGVVYSLMSSCANTGYTTTTNPTGVETGSPASCVTQTSPEPWYGILSSATIMPVNVVKNQIIQVSVTITFS